MAFTDEEIYRAEAALDICEAMLEAVRPALERYGDDPKLGLIVITALDRFVSKISIGDERAFKKNAVLALLSGL